MRAIILALAFAATIVPAHAISRYNSERMSCQAVQSAIRNEGAVILRYQSKRTPGFQLYDRYVLHDGFCQFGQFADTATVATKDRASCPVRKCVQRFPDDDDLFFMRRHH